MSRKFGSEMSERSENETPKKEMAENGPEIRYYDSFDQDFVTRGVKTGLPEGYDWGKRGLWNGVLRAAAYVLAVVWAFLYVYVYKRIRMPSRSARKPLLEKRGVCAYSNHTMAFGDVLCPFMYCFPRKPRIICSAENLTIPVLGKIIPYAGALPIPSSLHELARFNQVVVELLERGEKIIIYPEAHLWPYCNFVRPFNGSAFYYPAQAECPVVTVATVFSKKKIKLKISKPIFSEMRTKRERAADLAARTREEMMKLTGDSHETKVIYRKKNDSSD